MQPDSHLALAYIDAVSRGGVHLEVGQLEAFLKEPQRKRSVSTHPGMLSAAEAMMRSIQGLGLITQPGETTTQFLERVGWVTVAENRVKLTAIGQAMLSFAERPVPDAGADEPMVVTLNPADALSYLKVFDLMARHDGGMLVDPYLDFERLHDLMSISGVTRVLTSDRTEKKRLELMAHLLATVPDSQLEVRTVDRAVLHDRFFFPDEGPVYVLGTSLNSISKRPGVLVPIADDGAARAMREVYENHWSAAAVLTPAGDAQDDGASPTPDGT